MSVNTATIVDTANRPSDLFITAAALQRRELAPNPHAEAVALREPSKSVADDPNMAFRHLLEIARHLCNAGTAGLSLLRQDQAGQPIVRWEAISGALAHHEGTERPRDSSPCGLCLDAGTTILVSRPERTFTSLHDARPSIVEDLIVPLYDRMSKPLGTLWVAHHDGTSHFSADDARIVGQLAAQLVMTLTLLEQAKERLQVERASRETLAFKDAMILEANHRTKNTLQAAASLLYLHARATSSAQVREALQDSGQRLQLLAHAHHLLCTNPDNTQTVVMPSLLRTLGDALRRSFANASSAQVQLEFESDAIALPAEAATSIALFANEAVTNAYKHAFPNGSAGKITVQLRRTPENALLLRISDTGIGLHSTHGEGGGEGDGLGLKLIRILATQLQGSLSFAAPADAGGTVISLTIARDHDAVMAGSRRSNSFLTTA